jgi:predicted GIY-YIG superfamily endonuclease
MKNGTIYMYTSPSGKKYIGQTWNAKKRHEEHMCANKNTAFHFAIKKYGKDAFVYEVLRNGIATQDELNALERQEIAKHNTIAPNGYNLKPGGEGGKHHEITLKKLQAIWLDKDKREQIVSSMKAAAAKPETRNRLLKNAIKNAANHEIMEKKSTNLKKAFSSEKVRKQRSEQRKQEWSNPEIRERRIAGLKKAQSKDEYKKKLASQTAKRWQDPKYRQTMMLLNVGRKRPKSAIESARLKRMVKVKCIETGEIFESVGAAAKHFNISHSCISCALSGKQKTAGGKTWEKV